MIIKLLIREQEKKTNFELLLSLKTFDSFSLDVIFEWLVVWGKMNFGINESRL